MKNGDVLLLDEISLADDSVLERLNSVLEPARTVVLAEKGGDDVEGSLAAGSAWFSTCCHDEPWRGLW
jgi:midasin